MNNNGSKIMNNYEDINSPYYQFAGRLLNKRECHSCNASLKKETILFFLELRGFLFPHFSDKVYYSPYEVVAKLRLLQRNLITLLKINNGAKIDIDKIADTFISKIPAIHDMLWDDAEAIFKGDPAAESIDEVILAYPGFMAIFIYRIAHELYKLKVPVIPRILTEHAHEITGIDIHPGAEIDSPFFIDHGTGIVIGETTIIGKNVKIYQGVTLGALSVDKSLVHSKRHPTIQDDVIIYSQAVILGGETVVGSNSIIGGNAWVTQSVPPDSMVYSKSEVRVRANEQYFDTLEYII
jgi:serine O-acetyltransferase